MSRRYIVLVLVLYAAVGRAPAAFAQTRPPAFEIGAHLSTLRLGPTGNTNAGLGGRVSYDFSRWIAAEGEVNFFPKDVFDVGGSSITPDLLIRHSRRRVEAFAGAKVGLGGNRFGVFVKVRPGVTHLTDRGMRCFGDVCALILMLVVRPAYRTEFALDAGGVFEFYPSRRTVARVDLGTTAVRHRSQAPPCTACTSSNLSSSLGVGWKF